jgi:hypothetical protein
MSSWGNNDNAANAPYWAVSTVSTGVNKAAAAPTAANVALLYGNTTPSVYVTNETVGLFAVDSQEARVDRKGAHTGWVLRTTGSGGRAGRVTQEVLVALSTVNAPDGDAQVYANVAITLVGPTDTSVFANATYANTATFSVVPTLTGNTAATVTYQWQFNDNIGGTWTNVSDGSPANTNYTGGTTTTLSVKPADTTVDGYVFRLIATAADQGVTATSANGEITVA